MFRAPAVLTFLICVSAAGCGGPNVVSVSGTLTYKGKPVTNAFVNFVPVNGRPSMGDPAPSTPKMLSA
jgi:hypothetical protein